MNECSTTLSAITTIIIAMVGAFISWQQWNLNKQKLRLDLYDRRAKIYEEVKHFIQLACGGDMPLEKLDNFRSNVAHADFLFGPEIPTYLRHLALQGDMLHGGNCCRRDSDNKMTHRQHAVLVDELENTVHWFKRQDGEATDKFYQYLSMQI